MIDYNSIHKLARDLRYFNCIHEWSIQVHMFVNSKMIGDDPLSPSRSPSALEIM